MAKGCDVKGSEANLLGHMVNLGAQERIEPRSGLAVGERACHWVRGFDPAAGQGFERGMTTERDVYFRVPAFMAENQFATTDAFGQGFDVQSHFAERFSRRKHTGEGVHSGSVKSAGHNDQVGIEGFDGRNGNMVDGMEIGGVASPLRAVEG